MNKNLLEIYRIDGRRLISYESGAVIGEPLHNIHGLDIYHVDGIVMTFEIEYDDDEQEPT